MSFKNLNLSDDILKAITDKGYTKPTQIQESLIKDILDNHDIIASAQTGTGKSAGFLLPILQKISTKFRDRHYHQAIIIAPTKELVNQLFKNIEEYSKYTPIKSVALIGGSNFTNQANRLKNVDIIVATSGRLKEHIAQNNISTNTIDYLVLDEADTILDMGFIHEISQIITHLPKQKQTMLISATINTRVKELAKEILDRPKLIEVDKYISSNISQLVYPVLSEKKIDLLAYLIGSQNYERVLVFTRKKSEANIVYKELKAWGLKSDIIHGDIKVGDRKRALESFRNREIKVLVSTDIGARGLDIKELDVIISYDIPHILNDYIHRIGRTGRAGREGKSILLVSENEMVALNDLQKHIDTKIKQEKLEEYAPKELPKQKGAREKNKPKQKIAGAFGRKKDKKLLPTKKKRKTTKRDMYNR